ncbi:MAG: NAD-dependent epimerase/dehydratase family protein [Deltaproteobacteria bacterium]|nr:NAD-dependent epimerase/dehydratase family protein [Deltaproteobacteria bacterium]
MDGRRLLVTGGAGFIGSHLVDALAARGDDVTVLDAFDSSYDPALKERNLARVAGRVRVVRGDLCDAAIVRDAVRGADCVVHLAARTGVRQSLLDPVPYVRTNVEGTQVLLQAARTVEHLVLASSSSVYGARACGPFREDDPLGTPASPYAATKRAAEILCETWSRLYGTRITVLRFFTVYGPRQRPDMAVHRFLEALLAHEEVPVFGQGSSSRDYTYVGDLVAAVLAAVDRPMPGRVINLGSGRPVRLDALVDAAGRAAGRTPRIRHLDEQAGDVPMTWADIGRAQDLLGYRPGTTLEEGLATTVAWMRETR